MADFTQIDAYIDTNLDNSLEELATLCAQPSIAAQNIGLHECAGLVSKMLKQRGFEVEIIATAGAPVVFAERAGKSEKTILFYNHYDVQPPEPLELWDSPPFEATIRDRKIFARGVSDDKGHLTSRLFAIDAILASDGELPCRVKFIIEGEEETSSRHLEEFIRTHQKRLSADLCVWEFGGVDHTDTPLEYLGLRGNCYVEFNVETANKDVHSGIGGSIFPNAAWRLVWALNSLKDSSDRIQIAGFYDSVRPPSQRDLEIMEALPDIEVPYRKQYDLKNFVRNLSGVDLRVASIFEPTCTICGLTSGYQGEGGKTVLPATASAKIDFRLVPDQTPAEIIRLLRAHLDAHGFSDIKITSHGGGAPARTDPDLPVVKMVIESARDVYGSPMRIMPMMGGSGPSYAFQENLNHIPIVTSGISYPGTQQHAPNENVRLDLYVKGAKHITRILKNIVV